MEPSLDSARLTSALKSGSRETVTDANGAVGPVRGTKGSWSVAREREPCAQLRRPESERASCTATLRGVVFSCA